MRNRETGIIIENRSIATYYANAFFYNWHMNGTTISAHLSPIPSFEENDNTIYIVTVFTMTFGLIARDWRKRTWT